jgi:hypothetical protein
MSRFNILEDGKDQNRCMNAYSVTAAENEFLIRMRGYSAPGAAIHPAAKR